MLAKTLLEYPNIGQLIYVRQSAIKVEKSSKAAITVLQLLSCNIQIASSVVSLQYLFSSKKLMQCILALT